MADATKLRFHTTLDYHTLMFVAAMLPDDERLNQIEDVGARTAIDCTYANVSALLDEVRDIERATLLAETDDFLVLENPDTGDMGRVWVYDKYGGLGLDKETPFFDASDLDEIGEWLEGMRVAVD